MSKHKKNKTFSIDKLIDFGRQLFAGILRSRSGSLSSIASLLRFKPGTKSFHRLYEKLLPLINSINEAYKTALQDSFKEEGLLLGIIDDSLIKKTGKQFPKEKIQHDHTTGKYVKGMRVLSTALYKCGKTGIISSKIVGKEDNKLEVAKDEIDTLVLDYMVDVILFDSWYCKSPVLEKVIEHEAIFISRLRADSSVIMEEKNLIPLNLLAEGIAHNQYEHIRINGKSYWVCDMILEFKAYGMLRVLVSKEGQFDKPIFLTTNSTNFTAKFVVKLYLKRFMIEVFFKDAKQYLNFETFMCRPEDKWGMHLTITSILHWAIQKKKSISRTVRNVRESMQKCLLFINENDLIEKFIEELRYLCQT